MALIRVFSCQRAPSPVQNPASRRERRAAQLDLVRGAQEKGVVVRYTCTGNEAYVNPLVWPSWNVDQKRGLTRSLAAACDEEGSGDRITVIDHQSGKRLARFSARSVTID